MGGVAGDRGRGATGYTILGLITDRETLDITGSGIVYLSGGNSVSRGSGGYVTYTRGIGVDLSRGMPTGATFAPRSWGALACVYLGQPATA